MENLTKINTSSIEFVKWLNLLPWEPWLIPIQKHSKKPDVPEGESWKNAEYRLTVEEAKERIKNGLNVGVAATGHDFVFWDHDDPSKFTVSVETLTVETRNGKLHKHFINGGDVKNADGKGQYKGCGEVRAEWKYVLTPGSYVPPDGNALPGATGLYKIVVAKALATLHAKDIPTEFQPTVLVEDEEPKSMMDRSFTNQYGWSLKDIRSRDEKLDDLLSTSQPAGYPSASEADMATLSKLQFWGYSVSEAVDILKRFRGRKKLDRKDYITATLRKITTSQIISNLVNPKKWNPTTGYKINLFFSPPSRGGYISPQAETVEINKDALKPMSLTDVKEILSLTVKHDYENKLLVFLNMLMNYSGDDQQNILFNAPSSTGKSYLALEVAKFFPPEDVDKKGYTSPTAFFHLMGKMCTLDGEPLENRHTYIEMKLTDWEKLYPRPRAPGYSDKSREAKDARKKLAEWKHQKKMEYQRLKEEWNNIEKIYVVSLEKRILIFKDQPHDRVLQVLRSMLSHDEKILEVDITDKTKEGGHRTKKIRVVGFPTVVFCSAAFSLNEQERTRFWILSPDMSQDKIKESLKLQTRRLSHKVAFESALTANERRQLLTDRIQAIKNQAINNIIIPEKLADDLLKWFTSERDLSPRDMRDFPRLLDLVKAHALFQMFQRDRTGDNGVIATEEDVEVAKQLLNNVIEANRLGLPPYVHKFYEERLKNAVTDSGVTREKFSRLYFNMFKVRLGEKARKTLINLLSEAGLIQEKPDPVDKRRFKIYIPSEGGDKKPNISATALSTLIEMEKETGTVEKTVFLKELETKLNLTTDTVERLINKLLHSGVIFSPREGYLKRRGVKRIE